MTNKDYKYVGPFKKIVLDYLCRKSEIISSELMLPEDWKEVYTWTEEQCEKVVNRLLQILNTDFHEMHDGMLCPWCILFPEAVKNSDRKDSTTCINCRYGVRHGYCDNENSTYQKLINEHDKFFTTYFADFLDIIQEIERKLK